MIREAHGKSSTLKEAGKRKRRGRSRNSHKVLNPRTPRKPNPPRPGQQLKKNLVPLKIVTVALCEYPPFPLSRGALTCDRSRHLPQWGAPTFFLFCFQPMPAANPSLPPTKKRKIAARENDDIERIQRLEILLLKAVSSGTSLNPLVDLLGIAKNAKEPHLLFKCIYALYRVFASVIDARILVPTPDADAKIVRTWIFERFNIFTDVLVGLMSDSEKSLRVSIPQRIHHGGYQ